MKTTLYHKALAIVAVCAALLSGTTATAQESLHLFFKDGNYTQYEIKPETKIEFLKKAYIIEEGYSNVSPDTIFMHANAGRSFQVGVTYSNFPLEITVDADWLMTRQAEWDFNLDEHNYGYIFLVYAKPNTSDKDRFATLTLTAGDYTKTFVVAQQHYVLDFTPYTVYGGRFDNSIPPVTTEKCDLAWSDTTFYANISPNHNVKLISYPDWMTLEGMYNPGESEEFSFEYIQSVPDSQIQGVASGSAGALFKFAPNESAQPRSGKIVFEGLGQTAEITVTQEGLGEEQILRDAAKLNKDLYSCMELNQNSHDDFGFPSIMLWTDSRGTDIVSDYSGLNWFNIPLRFTDLAGNSYGTYYYWHTLYNQINEANKVIKNFGDRSAQSLIQFYLAQAYTIRAFSYFYLAQMYQHTYVGHEDMPCVPLVTEANMDEQNPRASVRETYNFMLSDLDKAAALLSQTSVKRPHKGFISEEVVYGLRARINMVRNDWTAALEDANRVINAGVASPYTRDEVSRPTFININDNAWLWGIDGEETDPAVTTGLINFPSHMGSFNYGYTQYVWRKVNKTLYRAIPQTDVRKGWFLDDNGQSQNLSAVQAAYASQYGMQPYTQVKFAPYNNELGTRTNASDIPLMRIEEMLLIAAEAQARLGNLEESRNALNTFVTTYRDPAYNCAATSQEKILDAIWMQRRIELWGEGHSYFDLIRLNKGIDRRGAGFQPDYVFNIPATDASLIYLIPDTEMNKNANLVNNPQATQPAPVEDKTQDQIEEEIVLLEATHLNKMLYSCNQLNNNLHYDFGFPSIMLWTDSRGTDIVAENSGYNWFSSPLCYKDLAGDTYPTYYYWRTLYNQINEANNVIKNNIEKSEQSAYQFYLAQAYTIRAFSYFYLAQMYQHTYVGHEDMPCVPLVTEANMDEQNPRASVRETYDFMLSDLDKAADLLEQTFVERPHKGFISKEVVYGLRARINMVRNNWTAALEDAERIINAGVASPYKRDEVSQPSFINISDNAWLWGIDVEETDPAVTTGIINFPSHMGSFNNGYTPVGVWRKINKALYNAIPDTDVRKGWFLNANGQSQNLTGQHDTYVAQYGMQPYTQVKFAPYNYELETATNASDIPLMRIEEILLIAAEAQARLGRLEESRNALNSFVTTYRDNWYNCTATSQEEILDAIWMQRRIELWGEGHSYFDLIRLNKGIDRRGAGFQPDYVFNIPAADASLIYLIPNIEMNKNANLVNNPQATQPAPVEDK